MGNCSIDEGVYDVVTMSDDARAKKYVSREEKTSLDTLVSNPCR